MTYHTTVMMESGQAGELVRVMRNTQNMLKVFHAYRVSQLQLGKTEDSPEILYINKKIREFENDLIILKSKCQFLIDKAV